MEKEFTELLLLNQGILFKIATLYFDRRKNIEDYKQELIIQLWKAFPSYKGQAKFSTWMYRVCINAAIDILRKEKTQPELLVFNEKQFESMADKKKELSQEQEKLYKSISKLTDIDKAVITLYLDEFSYKEIASIVGITESNTGVKINRIKSIILKDLTNGNK